MDTTAKDLVSKAKDLVSKATWLGHQWQGRVHLAEAKAVALRTAHSHTANTTKMYTDQPINQMSCHINT